ncbi:MAG: rod shape-determining protein RodA [Humibacillus sp.]|nr:rod shape-determining protein RodA [Humibacillus sp.]MDN5775504.1 rod shape-determining protein RodA [Humibacillus sp.]
MSRDPRLDRAFLTRTDQGGLGGPGRVGRRSGRGRSLLRVDLGLFTGAAGLSTIGVLLIWSATHVTHGSSLALKQSISVGLGMAAAVAVTRVDLRVVRALAPAVYLLAVLGLVAVISPLGSTVNGSRSWIRLPGGFTLQPSELMKVALAIGIAMLLADRSDRAGTAHRAAGRVRQRHRDVALAWVVAGIPTAAVLAQPDLGSAVVLVAMAVVIIATAGTPPVWTVGVSLAAIAVVLAAFLTPILSVYQRNRLRAFLDPSLDPQGIGYQTRQVRLAIGSGGWGGQGLFEGHQTQGGFIPFQETDFVFSVVGEELGFVGAVGLIGLIGFIVVRAVLVAGRVEPFGRLVVTGVAVWFGVQSFENIGMNLGITPVTGLPLPFVSYGGSSMVAAWIAVGLVGKVSSTTGLLGSEGR